MLVADTPNRICTSERRTTTHGPPIECPRCHRLPTHHPPARLLCETKPNQASMGSYVVDCPHCGTIDHNNNPDLTEQDHQRHDIRDMFREEQQRGTRGGGSGNGKSRKKPVKRSKSRIEQEGNVFLNSGSPARIVVTKKVEQLQKADIRVKLYIPDSLKTTIETESFRRERIDNRKWPLVRVIRSAMWAHASNVDMVCSFERGDKIELQLTLYPDEKTLLDEACSRHGCSRGEFIAACVQEFINDSAG